MGEVLCRLFLADESVDLHEIARLSKRALRVKAQLKDLSSSASSHSIPPPSRVGSGITTSTPRAEPIPIAPVVPRSDIVGLCGQSFCFDVGKKRCESIGMVRTTVPTHAAHRALCGTYIDLTIPRCPIHVVKSVFSTLQVFMDLFLRIVCLWTASLLVTRVIARTSLGVELSICLNHINLRLDCKKYVN